MDGWRCIASNPQTGVSTWVKEEEDGVLVQTRQDVSALLDANRAEANVASSGWAGDYHRIARIPVAMMHDKNQYIADAIRADDDNAVRRFLNDSDNQRLRTKGGRV